MYIHKYKYEYEYAYVLIILFRSHYFVRGSRSCLSSSKIDLRDLCVDDHKLFTNDFILSDKA